MASWPQLYWLPYGLIRAYRNVSKQTSHVKVQPLSFQPALRHQSPDSKDNCNLDVGLTHSSKTALCLHHATDISYVLTKPIARPDLITDPAEQYYLVLKSCLGKNVFKEKKTPDVEELSKMFYTTKHHWYPAGQYHTRRRNLNPPKDR